MPPIQYISTNRSRMGTSLAGDCFAGTGNRGLGSRQADALPSLPVSFADALFMGLAPDAGLFMPSRIPRMAPRDIAGLKGKPYHAVAYAVLRKYLEGVLPAARLKALCADAYNFAVPLEQVDATTWLLRLDRGPTASFKDFAARLMARLMQALKPARMRITVLVATSGDTGGAVGEAYRGLEGASVRILYPRTGVSPVQKRQLDSIGMNVRAIALDGTFDDCQRLVKRAFMDPDLRRLHLTSANSINIGRILPQTVYYFHAHAAAASKGEPVVFCVPSGNFGNSFGCELARRMGLPVAKIVLAVNANDEFPRFLRSGEYHPLPVSVPCLSNAMNVGNPSNLARYFHLFGGAMDKEGVVHRAPDIAAMRRHLYSVSVSDAETVATMKRMYARHGVVLEPHGAVGVAALARYRKAGGTGTAVCLETAHPAKFPEAVRAALGIEPEATPALDVLDARSGRADRMANDYNCFKQYLVDHEMD